MDIVIQLQTGVLEEDLPVELASIMVCMMLLIAVQEVDRVQEVLPLPTQVILPRQDRLAVEETRPQPMEEEEVVVTMVAEAVHAMAEVGVAVVGLHQQELRTLFIHKAISQGTGM